MAAFMRSCQPRLGWAGLAMRRTLPLVQAGGVGTLAPPPPARPCTINVCMLCSCLLSPAPQFFILLIRYGHMTAHCPQPTP